MDDASDVKRSRNAPSNGQVDQNLDWQNEVLVAACTTLCSDWDQPPPLDAAASVRESSVMILL